MSEADLRELTTRFPRAGRVEIYLRPQRRGEAVAVESARAIAGMGLSAISGRSPQFPAYPGGAGNLHA